MYEPANVAERINKLLKEKNLQQKDMLMESGLNKNTISSMLSRGSMVKADTLAKIADFLSCSVDYLWVVQKIRKFTVTKKRLKTGKKRHVTFLSSVPLKISRFSMKKLPYLISISYTTDQ